MIHGVGEGRLVQGLPDPSPELVTRHPEVLQPERHVATDRGGDHGRGRVLQEEGDVSPCASRPLPRRRGPRRSGRRLLPSATARPSPGAQSTCRHRSARRAAPARRAQRTGRARPAPAARRRSGRQVSARSSTAAPRLGRSVKPRPVSDGVIVGSLASRRQGVDRSTRGERPGERPAAEPGDDRTGQHEEAEVAELERRRGSPASRRATRSSTRRPQPARRPASRPAS